MENKKQNEVISTDGVGVTETQKRKLDDAIDEMLCDCQNWDNQVSALVEAFRRGIDFQKLSSNYMEPLHFEPKEKKSDLDVINKMILNTKTETNTLKVEIPSIKELEITKQDFESYESVRRSGITNMFDRKTVCELSNLSDEKVKAIMKNYSELVIKFPGVRKQ